MNSQTLNILACPACYGDLKIMEQNLICLKCQKEFQIIEDVPVLLDEKKNENSQHLAQKEYYNEEFAEYQQYKLENWRVSYIRRILKALRMNERDSKEFYLDIGVGGSGYTTINAAKQGIYSVGCDLSLKGMKKAKAFAEQQGVADRCQFLVCAAEKLPFKDNTFSYASSIAVLEHVPSDSAAIKELYRVAKKNSKTFVTVPNTYKRIWPFLWLLLVLHDKKVGHLRHYSEEDLQEKFSEVGFLAQKTSYTGHLIKFLQFFIDKLPLAKELGDKIWWRLENIDLRQHKRKISLNLSVLFEKKERGE